MRTTEYSLSDSSGNVIIRSYHSILSPQKREYREHHHTECELSVFLSGRGIYSVGKKEYEFAPGSVFIFGSNEAHCITNIYEDMDLLNVHFEARLIWERPENAELINLFAARGSGFCNLFNVPSIRDGILSLEKELASPRPCNTVIACCLLFSTLAHMIRESGAIDPKRVIVSHSHTTESLSKDLFNKNAGTNVVLDKATGGVIKIEK